MRCTVLLVTALLPFAARAADTSAVPATADIPKEVAAEEQYVLLSAKVKSLGEVQDLLLKQQQLIFQHIEELRKQFEALQADRTNGLTRSDLEECLEKVEQLRQRLAAVETNAALAPKPADPVAKTNGVRLAPPGNVVTATRYQGYRVQPGDTLSKVLLRLNDGFDTQGLQRVTQDQVERANPGINPERIRVGQMILIPIPDAKP